MQVALTDEERSVLVDVLDREFRDTKGEVAHTDTFEYKERLKVRERILVGLLQKLGGAAVTT